MLSETLFRWIIENHCFWQCCWSFCLGAISVGCVWCYQSLPDQLESDPESWVEPWNQTTTIRKRPKWKRAHWPWETIRRKLLSRKRRSKGQGKEGRMSAEKEKEEDEGTQTNVHHHDRDASHTDTDTETDTATNKSTNKSKHTGTDNDTNQEDVAKTEKEFCIGSIFGLDVGGTLAKLVYFEKKPLQYDPVSPRERHYHIAASAQAVSVARRGHHHRAERRNSLPRRRSFPNLGTPPSVSTSSNTDPNQNHNHNNNNNSNNVQSKAPLHSDASEEDLQRLESLRQESVPDDLSHYRTAVHYDTPQRPRRPSSSSSLSNLDRDEGSDKENDSSSIRPSSPSASSTTKTKTSTNDTEGNMRKSRSMFDLSVKQKKAVALDQFYNFARRLDSYQDSVRDHKLSFFSRELGGEFHFIRFETRRMRNAMELIRVKNLHKNICKMGATGGGAHKYADDWEKNLGIRMDKQEELDSLVAGMQFVLSTVVGECYTFRPKSRQHSRESSEDLSVVDPQATQTQTQQTQESIGAPLSDDDVSSDHSERSTTTTSTSATTSTTATATATNTTANTTMGTEKRKDRGDGWWWSRKVQRDAISYSSTYPYLLVTIGTGVSILRVDGPRKHERISGSSIGGGTYWGLIRLLTDVEDFDSVIRLAEKGDPSKVDMMVGDIYGKDSKALEKLGLPSDIVASSFGKLVAKEDPASGLKQEDLARALLLMVTNNIGQVAYLNAQLHKTSRIYFVGNFLRSNMISQRRLSYAINYWSKGKMEALFLEHEGYFGALGAFLVSQDIPNVEEGLMEWKDKTEEENNNSSGSSNNHTTSHHKNERRVRHWETFEA